jgi:hypothetical protein
MAAARRRIFPFRAGMTHHPPPPFPAPLPSLPVPAGIAPDDSVAGLVNLFTISATGQPIKAVAEIATADDEVRRGRRFARDREEGQRVRRGGRAARTSFHPRLFRPSLTLLRLPRSHPPLRSSPPPPAPRAPQYPRTNSLSCLWTSPVCYFVTGVGGQGISDSV